MERSHLAAIYNRINSAYTIRLTYVGVVSLHVFVSHLMALNLGSGLGRTMISPGPKSSAFNSFDSNLLDHLQNVPFELCLPKNRIVSHQIDAYHILLMVDMVVMCCDHLWSRALMASRCFFFFMGAGGTCCPLQLALPRTYTNMCSVSVQEQVLSVWFPQACGSRWISLQNTIVNGCTNCQWLYHVYHISWFYPVNHFDKW